MQVQFNRPVTLTADDGEQATFGKGVHPVPAKFCKGWYFEALQKDEDALVLKEDDEEGQGGNAGDSLLDGNVKEVVAKIEAAELSAEELAALAEQETAGKNRKGVLDAIAAKKGE